MFPSPQELGSALAQLVVQRAAGSGGRFSLGLSGGSLVGLLARELPSAASTGAANGAGPWLLAFCDERLVPPEHPESTFGAYRAQLLPRLPAPAPTVLAVAHGLSPNAAAADYAERLREVPGRGGEGRGRKGARGGEGRRRKGARGGERGGGGRGEVKGGRGARGEGGEGW